MRYTVYALSLVFFVVALSSPIRFAYAQGSFPQSDLTSFMSGVAHATNALWSSALPLPARAPLSAQELQTRSYSKDARSAQIASAIATAARAAAPGPFFIAVAIHRSPDTDTLLVHNQHETVARCRRMDDASNGM